MPIDPRRDALAQAQHYRQLGADHFRRKLRNARLTSIAFGIGFLLVAAAFAAMLLPRVGAAIAGPAPPLVFAILCPLFAVGGVLSLVVSSRFAPPSARLLATGQPGRATVHDVGGGRFSIESQSGTLVRSALVLDVEISGSAPYRVVHSTFVPPDCYPLLGKGNTLAVRVDTAKPSDLCIDWEASRPH